MRIHFRLKLGQQLALAFGMIILLAAMLAWLGWVQIKAIQYRFEGVVDRTLPTLDALDGAREGLQQLRIAELLHLTGVTMPEKAREEIKAKELAKAFDADVDKYIEVSAELGDAALIAQFKVKVAAFHKNRKKFFQMSNSAAGAGIERAQEAREYFNGEGMQAFAGAEDATRQLGVHHLRQAAAAKALGASALASAKKRLLGGGAVIVALSLLLAAFITLRVTHQLGGEPDHVADIARRIAGGDLSVPIPLKPQGDMSLMGVMGQMQTALRERVSELRETQVSLVAAARLAGMAEIATNVLHNVGNVLNSVNIAAELAGAQLRTSKLRGLARAVRLMDEHAADLGAYLTSDAKGRLLPGYLRELTQALEAEHAAMAQELSTLGKSVDHIKEVIAAQQSYAGTPRMVESLNFCDLLDDALRMNALALTSHRVEIVRHVDVLPALPLDRHRLLQILVNLIGNAKQALDGVVDRTACIEISAGLVETADAPTLRITVADNGEGIPPENLTRVFTHGFTTRENGHGFGLHSCALAALEMGGRLTAHSDGPQLGSAFVLDIPVHIANGAQ